MRAAIAGAVAGLCLAISVAAAAQTSQPLAPRLEIGIHTSLARDARLLAGGRIRVNLTDRVAFDIATDQQVRSQTYAGRSFGTDLYHAQLAWTFRQLTNTALFGSIGAGVRRFYETGRYDARQKVVLMGVGMQRRVLPYLAFRAELQWLTPEFDKRFAVGAAVPIGRYRQAPPQFRTQSLPPLPGETPVKAGNLVWVTTKDGNVCRGKVLSISQAAIDVRCVEGQRTIAVPDVRTIEAKDPNDNGILNGILAGAGVGALMGRVAASHDTGSDDLSALYTGVFSGIGAGIGAAFGYLIDNDHEGRRVIYRGSVPTPNLTLAPVIVRRGAGIGGVIRW